METEVDNPVIRPETAEEVLADLERYDKEPVPDKSQKLAKKDLPEPEIQEKGEAAVHDESHASQTPAAKPTTTDEKPETQVEKGEGDERPRDEHGRFVAKEAAEAVEQTTDKAADGTDVVKDEATQKSDTAYEKAKKDAERKDRSWKALEEEKKTTRAALDAEKAQLERERQQLQAQMQQRLQQNGERPRDEHGNIIYSSREYAAEAKRLRQLALKGETGPNGEDLGELSERAESASQYAAQREAKEYQTHFEQHQTNLAMEVLKSEPELSDPNSALAKEVQAVFSQELEMSQKHNRPSVFKMIPDGFALAVEVAKLRRQAFEAGALKEQLGKLQAEIERLNKLTSVSGSSPTQHRPPKPFEEMTTDEQLAAMDRSYGGGRLISR